MEVGQGSGSFSDSWRGRFGIAPKFRIYATAFGSQGWLILQAPFSECAIFREASCQKSGGFHQLGKRAREKGAPPRSCCVADLALCLRSLAASKYEGQETPSEGPLLMKTSRFLAGLPSFSASEAHRGVPLARASEPSDTYAWVIMSVGPDALLYGESVIAMLGLALINPTRMFVATPRRTRRKLPDSIKVEWVRSIRPTATYNGIPCQSEHDAILACKGKIPPDRLEAAARTAHEQGLISKQQYHALRKELRSDNGH